MKKVFFNRTDSKVIEFALNHTKEEFVKEFSNTTSTKERLEEAYDEIIKDKAVSKIGAKSGESKSGEPLKSVHVAMDENGELKTVDTTNIPVRTDLDDAEFTEDGRAIKKTKKVAKKEKVEKAEKKTVAKKEKQSGPSKRDFIRELIESNPEITNKEIKEAVKEKGFSGCYDSEIYACRKK